MPQAQRPLIPGVALGLLALLFLRPPGRAGEAAPRAGGLISLEQPYDRALAADQAIHIAFYEVRKAKLLPWSALTAAARARLPSRLPALMRVLVVAFIGDGMGRFPAVG